MRWRIRENSICQAWERSVRKRVRHYCVCWKPICTESHRTNTFVLVNSKSQVPKAVLHHEIFLKESFFKKPFTRSSSDKEWALLQGVSSLANLVRKFSLPMLCQSSTIVKLKLRSLVNVHCAWLTSFQYWKATQFFCPASSHWLSSSADGRRDKGGLQAGSVCSCAHQWASSAVVWDLHSRKKLPLI